MKKLLLILVAAIVLVMSQGLREVAAGDDEGIALKSLAGNYSSTAQGSFALCFGPAPTFTQVSCTASPGPAFVVPQTGVDVGNGTADKEGNSCTTYTQTTTDLPPDLSPPFVQVLHNVGKTKSYDSATGSGDATFISYSDGHCVGAVCIGCATVNSTGTDHFVVAHRGERLDFILTSLIDPVGGVGDFSYSGTNLRQ
jgi:hypothetical protein